MANWKTIEVRAKQSDDTEDSLNDEMIDLDDSQEQEQEQEEDDTDETVDLSDEDVLDEDSEEEEGTADEGSQEQGTADKKPSRAQERIRELVAKNKEAETRAAKAESERDNYYNRSVEQEKQSLDSEITATKAALERVKQDLKVAVEAGDADALIKGQEALSENKVRLMALESAKTSFTAEKSPKKADSADGKANVPEPALKWAERNDGWFNKNRALTGTAFGINQDLLEEGYDPQSPSFYAELDRRLVPFKPKDTSPTDKTKSGQEGVKKQNKTQVVGSSSKTVPPKSVKVTPQDQERARRLGIDPKVYLRQKAEYERNSQNSVTTFKPIFINKDKK